MNSLSPRVDGDVLGFRCPVPLEQRRDRLVDGEQPQGEVDEGVELLNFRFERGDAILRDVGHGRAKYYTGRRRPARWLALTRSLRTFRTTPLPWCASE